MVIKRTGVKMKLEIKEQVPFKIEDLRYSRWTMELLLEDIQNHYLDKQRVKEAIDSILILNWGYDDVGDVLEELKDLKKELGLD